MFANIEKNLTVKEEIKYKNQYDLEKEKEIQIKEEREKRQF